MFTSVIKRFGVRRIHFILFIALTVLIGSAVVIFHIGTSLSAAARHPVGSPPADLHAVSIEFDGLQGWYVPAGSGAPCVVLMHGVRSDRRSMINRAYMLRDAGYASLLFDFQAHGESPGDHITFGYLESANARSAVDTARSKLGCTKVAAIGQSLGGAAALLGEKPLNVQALIIESVYPTFEEAVADRLKIRFGRSGALLSPLLTLQMKYRMGIDERSLRPIANIAQFPHPLFVISGTEDRHTPIDEARRLFAAAQKPKEFWAVPGAAHVDLYSFSPETYRQHIIPFFAKYLSQTSPG